MSFLPKKPKFHSPLKYKEEKIKKTKRIVEEREEAKVAAGAEAAAGAKRNLEVDPRGKRNPEVDPRGKRNPEVDPRKKKNLEADLEVDLEVDPEADPKVDRRETTNQKIKKDQEAGDVPRKKMRNYR